MMMRKYFVRRNKKWVEEQIDKDEVFTDNNKTLCDIQLSCATEDHYYKQVKEKKMTMNVITSIKQQTINANNLWMICY